MGTLRGATVCLPPDGAGLGYSCAERPRTYVGKRLIRKGDTDGPLRVTVIIYG